LPVIGLGSGWQRRVLSRACWMAEQARPNGRPESESRVGAPMPPEGSSGAAARGRADRSPLGAPRIGSRVSNAFFGLGAHPAQAPLRDPVSSWACRPFSIRRSSAESQLLVSLYPGVGLRTRFRRHLPWGSWSLRRTLLGSLWRFASPPPFRSQGFSPSQRLDPPADLRICFTPHPPLGFPGSSEPFSDVPAVLPRREAVLS
jgi:hypothetical protein